MNAKLKRFAPSFVNDLQDVLDRYDKISPVIGEKVRIEIQSRLDLVSVASEGFPRIHRDIRAVRLKRFPYVLLYRSFGDHVQFVGLVLGSTERENWFDKIE
jgi:hypothetical protein